MGVRPGRSGTVVSLTGGESFAPMRPSSPPESHRPPSCSTRPCRGFQPTLPGPNAPARRLRLRRCCRELPAVARSAAPHRALDQRGRQGATVAAAIMNQELPADEPPYFWSDQFGLRLQCVGHPEGSARVELDGSVDTFRARYVDRNGRLVAALLANRPRETAALRRELARRTRTLHSSSRRRAGAHRLLRWSCEAVRSGEGESARGRPDGPKRATIVRIGAPRYRPSQSRRRARARVRGRRHRSSCSAGGASPSGRSTSAAGTRPRA